ncbi:MAG: hypothetical protein OES35_13840 [Chromatiales bacterium]|jgi:uncharacterized membrane protein|nr:hypothetical protein [Chromatiales bacterium]
MGNPENLLRLRKKHGEGRPIEVTAADGARLVRAQSFRSALVAALITVVVFCLAWISLSSLTDRVFPWMTVVLGGAVGLVIRHSGKGIDWRFPALAAVTAITGSVIGNIVVAASTTAAEYDTGTLQILQAVTTMTWPVFFDEVWNIADGFYAVVAGGVAAFYANRKLTRKQFYALRRWREESDRH